MEYIFWVLVLALIPAFIAREKGRSFAGFYIYGVLLFPIALIHSLFMQSENKQQPQHTHIQEVSRKSKLDDLVEPPKLDK